MSTDQNSVDSTLRDMWSMNSIDADTLVILVLGFHGFDIDTAECIVQHAGKTLGRKNNP